MTCRRYVTCFFNSYISWAALFVLDGSHSERLKELEATVPERLEAVLVELMFVSYERYARQKYGCKCDMVLAERGGVDN